MRAAGSVLLRMVSAGSVVLGLLASLGFYLDQKPASAVFKFFCLALGVYAPFAFAWLLLRWAHALRPDWTDDPGAILFARIMAAVSVCVTAVVLPAPARLLLLALAALVFWRRRDDGRPEKIREAEPPPPLGSRLVRLAALLLVEMPDAWLASRRSPPK